MKRYLIIIVIAGFFIQGVSGQVPDSQGSRILFQGLIMDAETQIPLSGSQIILNRSFSSVSDSEGKFAFYVLRHDTVVFRRLGYQSITLFVSDTLTGREFITGIYMNTDTVSIGEVVIVPRLVNLRSQLYNPRPETNQQIENAKYNLEVSAYQGRISQGKLGDPDSNYELLRQKQKIDAYEKGGIPSDKIVGISPLLLIPAAYLLMNGFPERPEPLKPQITRQEIEQLHKKYLETHRKNY
jgi:hypothetical protein